MVMCRDEDGASSDFEGVQSEDDKQHRLNAILYNYNVNQIYRKQLYSAPCKGWAGNGKLLDAC